MYIYIIYKRSHEGSKRFSNIGPTRHLYAWGVPNIYTYLKSGTSLSNSVKCGSHYMGASNRSPKYPQTMESIEPSAMNLQVSGVQIYQQLFRSCWSWVGESTVVGRLESLKEKVMLLYITCELWWQWWCHILRHVTSLQFFRGDY